MMQFEQEDSGGCSGQSCPKTERKGPLQSSLHSCSGQQRKALQVSQELLGHCHSMEKISVLHIRSLLISATLVKTRCSRGSSILSYNPFLQLSLKSASLKLIRLTKHPVK